MKAPTLSKTQTEAVELARKHGGRLVRYHGGFWAGPGWDTLTRPRPWFEWRTIRALIDRGVFVPDEYKRARVYLSSEEYEFLTGVKLSWARSLQAGG